MNEPKRLLLGEASARERALLLAGAAEEPPPDAAALFAASLGLPPRSTPTPPEAAGPQPPSSLPTTRLATSKLATSKLVMKWLAFAGAGVMAISSSWLVSRPQPEQPPSRAVSAPQSAPSERDDSRQTQQASRPERRSEPPQTSSIAGEIEKLEQVRSLLRTEQSALALRKLDDYHARYPRGALREEAEFMHIEALTGAGRQREARQRAARFLEVHPHSIHAARVRALLEPIDAR